MNLEAFLWATGPLDLPHAAPGTPFKIGGKDRPGIEFGLQKEILVGKWTEGLFVFEGFGKGGEELLTLLAEPARRRAAEERFPTRTQFHVKSALRFVKEWQAPAAG
jgi:hypothetical protein